MQKVLEMANPKAWEAVQPFIIRPVSGTKIETVKHTTEKGNEK